MKHWRSEKATYCNEEKIFIENIVRFILSIEYEQWVAQKPQSQYNIQDNIAQARVLQHVCVCACL